MSSKQENSDYGLLIHSFNLSSKNFSNLVVVILVVASYISATYFLSGFFSNNELLLEGIRLSYIPVAYGLMGYAVLITHKFLKEKGNLILNIDELNIKRYFFNVQMREPSGSNSVEKFLSLAKEIDPTNERFTKFDDIQKTIEFDVPKTETKIEEKLDAVIKMENDIYAKGFFRGNYERYFIVKYFEEPLTFDRLDEFLLSLATLLIQSHTGKSKNNVFPKGKLSQLFRLVILCPKFDQSIIDETKTLLKSVNAQLMSNSNEDEKYDTVLKTWANKIDLIQEQKRKDIYSYRFVWTSLLVDEDE